MYWTTYTNCDTPTMVGKEKHHNPSLLDMLLPAESHKRRTEFNNASSNASKTEEEEDDDILLAPVETTEDIFMSSISLDDSSHLFNSDDGDDETSNTAVLMNSTSNPSRHSFTTVVLSPEETLFDAKEQRYEWNDEFSVLKKLRRTRLSTVVEDDRAPMFQSASSYAG
jgi:hypothetical protein